MKILLIAIIGIFVAPGAYSKNILTAESMSVKAYPKLLANVLDGKMSTIWHSYRTENASHSIQADFKEAKQFNTISVYGDNIEKCDVSIRKAQGSWEALEPLHIISDGRLSRRYDSVQNGIVGIRFTFTGGAEKNSIRICELAAYTVQDTKNKALFKRVIYKDSQGFDKYKSERRLTDGNVESIYENYSNWQGATPIIDLGKSTQISKVILKERGVLNKITISVSDDYENWTEISNSHKGKKVKTVAFDPVSARYVMIKLEGLGRNFLCEVEIY